MLGNSIVKELLQERLFYVENRLRLLWCCRSPAGEPGALAGQRSEGSAKEHKQFHEFDKHIMWR